MKQSKQVPYTPDEVWRTHGRRDMQKVELFRQQLTTCREGATSWQRALKGMPFGLWTWFRDGTQLLRPAFPFKGRDLPVRPHIGRLDLFFHENSSANPV